VKGNPIFSYLLFKGKVVFSLLYGGAERGYWSAERIRLEKIGIKNKMMICWVRVSPMITIQLRIIIV